MSEKMEAVATSEAPVALGAYSQAVKANGFVFVSGQLGIDPTTGELAGDTAGEQTAQALKNIKQILDTAGTGIEHVVRATIYMKNVEDFKEVDARYADVFIGSVKPARVAIGGNDIPFGSCGYVVAVHPKWHVVEVVMDKPFIGGSTLYGLLKAKGRGG